MGAQNIDHLPKQWLFRVPWSELCSLSGSFMLGMQREGLTDQLLRENNKKNSIPDYLDDELVNHELKKVVAYPGFVA